MRTTLGALSAAAFLLTLIHVVAAGEDKDARAAIDKGIQAAGGETKLATFQASTWKEKGTYYGMGDGLPYTATYAVQGAAYLLIGGGLYAVGCARPPAQMAADRPARRAA